jgi:hypothetical protein
MIVGKGDIAQFLIDANLDRDDVIFFASGVSNSKETSRAQFMREYVLLAEHAKHRLHLVYFSSLSIYYSDSDYAVHKRTMEHEIQKMFKTFSIFRIGNISWGNNPNTIINHFVLEHAAGRTPELRDEYRHVISKPEFVYWIKKINLNARDFINIPGEFVNVKEIWRRVKDGKY